MTGFSVNTGNAAPLGVTADATGANVAVFSGHAEAIALCVFDEHDQEVARLRLPGRTGDVFHGHVAGLTPGMRYGLRAFGPWDKANGHWFNPAKLLVDPYATVLDRPFRLHPSLFDYDTPDPADTAPLMPKALVPKPGEPTTTEPVPPARANFDWRRQVIYELHVRGFTALHPDIPPVLRGTFAGLGHPAALAYLTSLGVTTVELMPCMAWADERHLPPLGLTDYWGYNPMALLAPDPRLAPGGWTEIRVAVAALQHAGIAVILDVVLNHSAESDHLGPTLSLRGLDNATYYRGEAGNPARFVNHAGCGNILALDRPPVLHLALAALRQWADHGGLDGFRLDLAATLGRRENGFDPAAPLLQAMQADPVLSRRVIIAEPWDIGPDGYQLGRFPAGWGEWNDRFRDTVRRFWRGDHGMIGELATRFAGSTDLFAPRRRPASRSVNYVTAHDGFTMADLVSFVHRDNRANGEDNQDGSSENYSWNNGVEGETDDALVLDARKRDVRALLGILLLSRGTPMLSMGDEAGRSQRGNNNAYAQDNALAWFDWSGLDHTLRNFTARLIRARLDCPALFDDRTLSGAPVDGGSFPDIQWLRPDGTAMTASEWEQPGTQTLITALHAAESRAMVIVHRGSNPLDIALPEPRRGQAWHIRADSADPARAELAGDTLQAAARSVLLLIEVAASQPVRRPGVSGVELDRLASEAGISPVWWDVDGRQYVVSQATKLALLDSMRLPARSLGDLEDSWHRLRAPRSGIVPPSLVTHENEPIHLRLAGRTLPSWLTVLPETGPTLRIPIPRDQETLALPKLPSGRHRLLPDERWDQQCRLTVAPSHCFLPPRLAAGEKRFGVATHLYTLRRDGDGGIGDFTALAQLAAAAHGAGAATVGLNPLHALFPGDRTRASPYHPSDRRFLDPIYIDVAGVPGAGIAPMQDGLEVDYPAVWAAKHRCLRAAFDAGAGGDPGLDAFITAGGPALRRFASFAVIAEALGSTHWRAWPPGMRHPASADVERFAAEHARDLRFVCFQQYIAERQLAEAVAGSRLELGFYMDLAVGAAPDGAEAWSRQDVMMTGVSVGAPPDPFSDRGQIWCLPPPDPLAMAREGYDGFAELLRANMRHAGALRIDHVMGLQRLFLVPDGARASEGAYLGYPFRDLVGTLALESQRARCMVVGEALGTVPEGFTEALSKADVLSYSVLWFERDGLAPRPPAAWKAHAAACVSTHDLPTVTGWWAGADIAERVVLGLLETDNATAERAVRATEKAAVLDLLRREGLLVATPPLDGALPSEVMVALHALIAATPALLALAQVDDLAGEANAVNLPGTDKERPNWRRRLRPDVAALFEAPTARAVLEVLRAGRIGQG